MENVELDPTYLRKADVEYELAIRGCVEDLDVNTARSKLKYLMLENTEAKEEEVKKYESENSFSTKAAEIEGCIRSIENNVNSYNGKDRRTEQRIKTRIKHVTERIKRTMMDDSTSDWEQIKNGWNNLLTKLHDEMVQKKIETENKVLFDQLSRVSFAENVSKTSSPNKVSSKLDSNKNLNVNDDLDNLNKSVLGPSISRNIVPVYKWAITFSGQDNELSVNSFLERVEELRIARGNTKEDLFNSAIDLFRGPALIWYRSIRANVSTWEELTYALKLDFLPSDYDEELYEEIRHRKQGQNEKTCIYVAIMENMFNRLIQQPSELERLKIIRRNLIPQFNSQLALIDIRSIGELNKLCRKLEESREIRVKSQSKRTISILEPDLSYVNLLESKNKQRDEIEQSRVRYSPKVSNLSVGTREIEPYTSEVKQVPPRVSNTSNKTCWNCNAQGHLSFDCKNPKNVYCFKCGAKGKTLKTCNCVKNERKN